MKKWYKAKIREDIPTNHLSITGVEKYRGKEVYLKLYHFDRYYKYIGRLPYHNCNDWGWNDSCFEWVEEVE